MNRDIISSWNENAGQWARIIKEGGIASRSITNGAIVERLKAERPSRICDIGCGEGWLTRELSTNGMETVGIDGTQGLIEAARALSNDHFYIRSYEEIIEADTLPNGMYEAVVLNFCLYLDQETSQLLKAVKNSLMKRRLIFIQTLHPFAFMGTGFEYQSQWLHDSWKGLPDGFKSPHSWYYRTLAHWQKLFKNCGLELMDITEPIAPKATVPSSIIFTLTVK